MTWQKWLGLGLLLVAGGGIWLSTGSNASSVAAVADSAEPRTILAADFETLQEALDAVPAAGGVVVLPPGEFLLDQPLIVRTEDTRITGAGGATRLVNQNTTGQPAIHLRNDTFADKKTKLWRVQLDNFRVIGNENSGPGILAEGIQEIFLQGLTVSYHGHSGIFLYECFEDPRVCDNVITYNKQAGLEIFAGHDIVVNANHFEENLDGVYCYDSYNLTMNGNNLDDHLRHGVVIENTYGSVLAGNMIEECNGWGAILDRNCYGITLSANVFAHDMQGGIDLRDAWGCAISANTFTLIHNAAVRVSSNSGRINISANAFSNSETGERLIRKLEHENPLQLDAGSGVVLEQTSDVLISGNTFTGLDGAAVECRERGAERIQIHGNLVSDYGRRQSQPPVAFAVPEGDTILLSNNLIGPAQMPRTDR